MDDHHRILELLDGPTTRGDEAKILGLLARSSDAGLDATLAKVDLGRLISDIDDRLVGPDNRERLIDLLTRERVDALSPQTRARLIRAFSRGRTSHQDERAIHAVLLASTGTTLTAVKRWIDMAGDHRHLLHIVYSDIDDAGLRAQILAHIRREAAGVQERRRLVLSDIDDTIYSNFGDRRWPKKTIYPGVLRLYELLSRDAPVFVTARPADRTGIVEALTQLSLRKRGIQRSTVLAGDLLHIHNNDAIAARKLSNFQAYAELFAEFDFVFIGDSSQGDAAFGASMHEQAPDRVHAVLIHDVTHTEAAQRDEWGLRGVRVFDNYVGAARILCELGILDADAWRSVAAAAREEFAALGIAEAATRERLQADLDAEL